MASQIKTLLIIIWLCSLCPSSQGHEVDEFDSWCETDFKMISYTLKWTISNFSLSHSNHTILSSTFKFGEADQEKSFRLEFQLHNNNQKFLILRMLSTNKPFTADILLYLNHNLRFKTGNFSHGVIVRTLVTEDELVSAKDKLQIICKISTIEESLFVHENDETTEEPDCCGVKNAISPFLNNSDFSDVTLLTVDASYSAHKVILAARSPVFAAIFKANRTIDTVVIDNIAYETVPEMLRFIYNGTVENIDKLATDLLEAAEKYRLDGLKFLCGDALLKNLTVETAAEILMLANGHRLQNVKKQAILFIKEHEEQVKKTKGWKTMARIRRELVVKNFPMKH